MSLPKAKEPCAIHLQVFFTGQDAEQLYGRVELGKGPLGNALYPLYFRVNLQPSIVPGMSADPRSPGIEIELRGQVHKICTVTPLHMKRLGDFPGGGQVKKHQGIKPEGLCSILECAPLNVVEVLEGTGSSAEVHNTDMSGSGCE